MSNKGGAGILALPDDFCDFFSLERVYGYNLLLTAANNISTIVTGR
jgi:hypothetical protein